jgi:hypothetical protein
MLSSLGVRSTVILGVTPLRMSKERERWAVPSGDGERERLHPLKLPPLCWTIEILEILKILCWSIEILEILCWTIEILEILCWTIEILELEQVLRT